MRSEGFIFNHGKCVACSACTAACRLENGWDFSARNIYTYNEKILPGIPLINISMACNHCSSAVCMEGCPASAYSRNGITGAIIIDDKKCIGCRYCVWNCPYEAPVLRDTFKVIGKCNLCSKRLVEGLEPACSSACPTGALKYGKLNGQLPSGAHQVEWFPDKNLDPRIEIHGGHLNPVHVIPSSLFETKPSPDTGHHLKSLAGKEWSLAGFSFLATVSAAVTVSSYIRGTFPGVLLTLLLLSAAAVFSVFHLGRKVRAWRSLVNAGSSPLSREIAIFIVYSVLAILAGQFRLPYLLIAASLSGIALVLSIDAVYLFADKRKETMIHSGQSFISCLLISAFLANTLMPFLFIALLKFVSVTYFLFTGEPDNIKFRMRFFRLAFLVISGAALILPVATPFNIISVLFFAGEIADRLLFYADFRPLSITGSIKENIKYKYEKSKNQ